MTVERAVKEKLKLKPIFNLCLKLKLFFNISGVDPERFASRRGV